MVALYNAVFYEPLFNLLVVLYNTVALRDLGLAIVALTAFIRLLLYPLAQQSIRAQKAMADLQPKLDTLKQQFAGNREKLAEATMQLYRAEKVNPLSSCLPLLIQLPFFIALFHVFQNGTKPESLSALYPFVGNPGALNPWGLGGLVDLSARSPLLALLAGAAQFWQGHMLVRRRPSVKTDAAKDEDFAAIMNQQMTYVMPVVTVVIGWQFPAGLALYWFLTTLFLAVQQWYVFRRGQFGSTAPGPSERP
jgi:YidC/Oxa1 family membrane protein insertase